MKVISDKELEAEIAGMLRIGVILSAVVVLAGGLFYFHSAPTAAPDYAHFHPEAASLRTIAGAFTGAVRLDAESIIQIGILLLIATPVVRVIFCVVGFARQRDMLYVGISAGVLAILTYSLIPGSR